MDDQDWTARRLRQPVQLEAKVHRPDGEQVPTLIRNLSTDGCCVEGSFIIGDFVDINIPRVGLVRGQVRWAINDQAGIRFLMTAEQQDG